MEENGLISVVRKSFPPEIKSSLEYKMVECLFCQLSVWEFNAQIEIAGHYSSEMRAGGKAIGLFVVV